MQKAIENFINIQLNDMKPFNEIEVEIDKVEEAAIQKAKTEQLRRWRKENK